MPGFPVHPQLLELAQTLVWKGQRHNCSQRPLKSSSQVLNRYRGKFTQRYILTASFSQLFFPLKFLLHREISAMRVTLTAFVSHVISMTNLSVTSLPVWTSSLVACSNHTWFVVPGHYHCISQKCLYFWHPSTGNMSMLHKGCAVPGIIWTAEAGQWSWSMSSPSFPDFFPWKEGNIPISYIQWILEGEVQHIAFPFNGRILRLGNLVRSHRVYLNCFLSYCHCCIFGIWQNSVSSGKCIDHPEREVARASVRQWMRECELPCSPHMWCFILLSHLPQSLWSFLRFWSSHHPSHQAGAMSPWSASPQETERSWRWPGRVRAFPGSWSGVGHQN